MRTLVVISVFAALVIAADTAAAQQALPSLQQGEQAIQVSAPSKRFKPQPEEVNAVIGTYDLDNGAVLRVARDHRKVTVYHAPNGTPVELIPVGRYIYMAADRSVMMEFNRGGDEDEVMVTYHPDTLAAERHGSVGRVAAR